ncbi:uncharacterized protein LOC118744106 [Rhagoletis pomonella]|uniref:uncharacterized protein LOC118744106 n=1 Tax=Rhagoletis pomonella TaxID=28610 RepID=UPI0017859195|nr:uncharacterized protein LOC118744106 [Rhagoletis pomonella]
MWQTLRDKYSRELRKLDAPSGSAAVLMDHWPLIENMSFLKEFVKPRPYFGRVWRISVFAKFSVSESSVLTDSSDFEESPLFTEEFACGQSTPKTSQKKRKRQENDADGEFREVCKMYKDLCEERAAQKGSDTLLAFGQMIVSTVSEMSPAKEAKAIQIVTNDIITFKLEHEE